MKIKQELYNNCQDFLNTRLEVIQNTILDIQKSLQSETKSSAGDKHETGRAMLQLEREKAGHQLSEVEKLKEVLNKINVDNKSNTVILGSVVYTTQSNYFIAISAGEIKVNDEVFYAISANTPIGKLLLGKNVGSKIRFRASAFEVTNLF